MNKHLSTFIKAIHEKKFIKLRYRAKKDSQLRERKCIPCDFSPGKNYHNGKSYYWVYDLQGSEGAHISPIEDSQILSLEILEESFNPMQYINVWHTYNQEWSIKRNW